jgi:hypothetical protein
MGGNVMCEFIHYFLPLGAAVFLIIYIFLFNPDALTEFGWWLQKLF